MQNEREWVIFCDKVLQRQEIATDPRFDSNAKRNEHRQALKAVILEVFSGWTTTDVEQRLDEAQIANGRMNDMAGVWSHPQLKARERWRSISTPSGPLQALLPPAQHSTFEYRMDAVPAVGEHTDAIMWELGLAR